MLAANTVPGSAALGCFAGAVVFFASAVGLRRRKGAPLAGRICLAVGIILLLGGILVEWGNRAS